MYPMVGALPPQAIGVTMLGFGIYSVVDMQQYGTFSDNSFVAGAAIFVGVGVVKMAFSVIGMVATFVHKKPLFAVVSHCLCSLAVSTELCPLSGNHP